MKALKKIAAILAVILIGFSLFVATRPSDYTISREVAVNAPPEVLFPYINNSKKMDSWNPFMKMDPSAKVSFSGPEEGVGATTTWVDGKKLGSGSCTVTEIVPNSKVVTHLEFTKPQHMTQSGQIELTPSGNQTIVKWSASGHNSFMCKAVCVFMNMDKMVGGTFETGLQSLKTMAETPIIATQETPTAAPQEEKK